MLVIKCFSCWWVGWQGCVCHLLTLAQLFLQAMLFPSPCLVEQQCYKEILCCCSLVGDRTAVWTVKLDQSLPVFNIRQLIYVSHHCSFCARSYCWNETAMAGFSLNKYQCVFTFLHNVQEYIVFPVDLQPQHTNTLYWSSQVLHHALNFVNVMNICSLDGKPLIRHDLENSPAYYRTHHYFKRQTYHRSQWLPIC